MEASNVPYFNLGLIFKTLTIICSFVAAGCMLGSDLVKHSKDLKTQERAAALGAGVVFLFGGVVAIGLLISYVGTTLRGSTVAKLQNASFTRGQTAIWTVVTLVFSSLYLGIYCNNDFLVEVVEYDRTGKAHYYYTPTTIFSPRYPGNGQYSAVVVFGFLAVLWWLLDFAVSCSQFNSLKRGLGVSLSLPYTVVKVFLMAISCVVASLMISSALWQDFGAGSHNQVASKVGLGVVALISAAVSYALLSSYLSIAVSGSSTHIKQHKNAGLVLSLVMVCLTLLFSIYFIGAFASSHWNGGDFENWWDDTIFAKQSPGYLTYWFAAIFGIITGIFWFMDFLVTYYCVASEPFTSPKSMA
eukprot:Clim_evm77s33 gene=Clim_evmTU77s33